MFKEHPLFFRRWGCPEPSGMQDRPGFFRVAWALLSLLSAFPLLGAGLPQSRALPKSHSLLPAAIKGAVAAVIREMAVLLFLERGLETGGAQVRRAVRAAAAPGERAPGIGFARVWSCTLLSLEQPSMCQVDSFWMNVAWSILPRSISCAGLLGAVRERSSSGTSRALLTSPALTWYHLLWDGQDGNSPSNSWLGWWNDSQEKF